MLWPVACVMENENLAKSMEKLWNSDFQPLSH